MHAVIFDIDGTLLDSAGVDDLLYRRAVTSVLGPVRFRESLADYDHVTDVGVLRQVFEDNAIASERRRFAEIETKFIEALDKHIREHGPFDEIPGAKQLLADLRASDSHAVAIATGGWRRSAELKLASAAFDVGGIPLASGSDHHDRARIMRHALSSLRIDVETVTYYGDGIWDRDACKALGWRFVPVGPVLGGLSRFRRLSSA